jgi:hypothetical protein
MDEQRLASNQLASSSKPAAESEAADGKVKKGEKKKKKKKPKKQADGAAEEQEGGDGGEKAIRPPLAVKLSTGVNLLDPMTLLPPGGSQAAAPKPGAATGEALVEAVALKPYPTLIQSFMVAQVGGCMHG